MSLEHGDFVAHLKRRIGRVLHIHDGRALVQWRPPAKPVEWVELSELEGSDRPGAGQERP